MQEDLKQLRERFIRNPDGQVNICELEDALSKTEKGLQVYKMMAVTLALMFVIIKH